MVEDIATRCVNCLLKLLNIDLFFTVCHCFKRPSRLCNAAALLFVALRVMLTQVTIDLLRVYANDNSVPLYCAERCHGDILLYCPSLLGFYCVDWLL